MSSVNDSGSGEAPSGLQKSIQENYTAREPYTESQQEQIERIKTRLEQTMAINLLSLPRHSDRPKSPGLEKLSDFQKTKFDYMFDILYGSSNSDAVSREDFWKLLKTAIKMRDWSPIHPGYRDLQSRIASIWAGLIKGTLVYKPGGSYALVMEISRVEWHHYWGDFVEAASMCKNHWPETSKDGRIDYQCQRDFRDFMFTLMDLNGDGAIDKQEYVQCLSAFGIFDHDSEEAFERDGAIDKQEYVQCLSAFGIFDHDSEEAFERILELRSEPASKWEKYIPKAENEDGKEEAENEEPVNNCFTESDFDELWLQYLTSDDRTSPGNFVIGPSPVYL